MPNIGQIVLMLPVQMKYAHADDDERASRAPPRAASPCRAIGAWNRPRNSCTRKRATRVPVSIVVRMNSASNMIAKWYQYSISPRMPGRPLKICAMPTPSDTAPPGRPATASPTARSSCGRFTDRNAERARTSPAAC